jgi:hypothetical protein
VRNTSAATAASVRARKISARKISAGARAPIFLLQYVLSTEGEERDRLLCELFVTISDRVGVEAFARAMKSSADVLLKPSDS